MRTSWLSRGLRWIVSVVVLFVMAMSTSRAFAQETLWLEVENFDGIKGYCWPQGRDAVENADKSKRTPAMYETNGNWGISGPGWASEWNQGGESGFMSIATGPGDDKAVVSKNIIVPAPGKYRLWVRYADWREQPERFQIAVEQAPGNVVGKHLFGEKPIVEENNEAKLYWGWAFAWDSFEVDLKAGPAKVVMSSIHPDPVCRQVDVIVLTTDAKYRPYIKERPLSHAWQYLESVRRGEAGAAAPLVRNPLKAGAMPDAWKLHTFRDKGFVYLWNTDLLDAAKTWTSDDPKRVLFPYHLRDAESKKEFEEAYGGRKDVPIFSDPRIAPGGHSVGAKALDTNSKDAATADAAQKFVKWLDANPTRMWGSMMNYHPDQPLSPAAADNFLKYRDRYIGAISGENLGYFEGYFGKDEIANATKNAKTRRELVEAFTPVVLAANAKKYKTVYGDSYEKLFGNDPRNAMADVISCQSIHNIMYAPLTYYWGMRTAGYESAVFPGNILAMRWAFMRGGARQWSGLTATYRSSNFGDSATMYTDAQNYSKPANILDNYYSVYSGTGPTWYKFDIWYQYMAGSSVFYHEQGFQEFWKPGGTTAAGIKKIQLSPFGKLVDQFLRKTAENPERGTPYTPVAFLADYAHGWEPAPYKTVIYENLHHDDEKWQYNDQQLSLQELFWAAYYPVGPMSQKPITAISEVNVAGMWGDIFDVIYAYPDVKLWKTIDTYPAVVVAGDIDITPAEGKRLKQYVEQGGTLVVADGQLIGAGASEIGLPKMAAAAEADGYVWAGEKEPSKSQRYSYRAIEGGTPLATTPDGKTIASYFDVGKGRLVVLSVPRGLGIDRQLTPMMARLMRSITTGLMPVEVTGDVEWLVNKTPTGWIVTIINPYGQDKPQQGITPTDYRQNRTVTLRVKVPVKSAVDRLLPSDAMTIKDGPDGTKEIEATILAGSLRLIELK